MNFTIEELKFISSAIRATVLQGSREQLLKALAIQSVVLDKIEGELKKPIKESSDANKDAVRQD
jgi:hypothetical protein